MSTLKAWLNSEAVSLEGYEMSDGEQKLDVHVEPEASIDHDVAEMSEAKLEQDEIQADCDTLVEAQAAMEAYQELLEHGLENGGISSQSAAFMRVGLERYETLFGMDQPLTPSNEAFGGSASQQHSTQVSLEAIGEQLKKSWEAIKRALVALVNAIKDVYAKATNAASRLEKRAQAIRQKAEAAKGKQPKQDKVAINGASKLFADGVWKGDDILMVSGFMTYALGRYPENAIKYAQGIINTVGQIDPANTDKTTAANILKMTDTLMGDFDGSAVRSGDKRFPTDTEVKRSEVLPGNKALYIAQPSVKGDELAAMKKLASTLRADMLDVPEAKVGEKVHHVTAATPEILANRARQIATTAGMIGKAKVNGDKIKKVVDDMMKAGDTLKEKADKAELDKDQKKMVDAILRGMVSIQKLLGGTINGIVSYGVTTLNAQLAVIERQLAQYGGSDDKEETA